MLQHQNIQSGENKKWNNLVTSYNALSLSAEALRKMVHQQLEDSKAIDIIEVPLAGKSDIADFIFVASGGSSRQVAAIARHICAKLKSFSHPFRVEGLSTADWVLVDAGDVIIHLFRPEVRTYYQIEKIWQIDFSAARISEPSSLLQEQNPSKDTAFS